MSIAPKHASSSARGALSSREGSRPRACPPARRALSRALGSALALAAIGLALTPGLPALADVPGKASADERVAAALREGAALPPFSLPSSEGAELGFEELRRERGLVLVVFRGVW